MAKRVKCKRIEVDPITLNTLKKKADKAPCTYRISGIAYSKKGNILGIATNKHSTWDVMAKIPLGRAGTAEHCEKRLIERFKRRIKTIVICRIGKSGNILPIDPCDNCRKLAEKYGITITSVKPTFSEEDDE